jgi:hypothetical protein
MNQCGRCREDFSSVEIFDRHRVGDHQLDWPEHVGGRRCLDEEEMEARGWRKNSQGRWVDPPRAERARRAFA